jgi:hypothetical protein
MTTKKYLIPKARCRETGETVKSQNLVGRYQLTERWACQQEAEYLAQRLRAKTGRFWSAFIEVYELQGDINRL